MIARSTEASYRLAHAEKFELWHGEHDSVQSARCAVQGPVFLPWPQCRPRLRSEVAPSHRYPRCPAGFPANAGGSLASRTLSQGRRRTCLLNVAPDHWWVFILGIETTKSASSAVRGNQNPPSGSCRLAAACCQARTGRLVSLTDVVVREEGAVVKSGKADRLLLRFLRYPRQKCKWGGFDGLAKSPFLPEGSDTSERAAKGLHGCGVEGIVVNIFWTEKNIFGEADCRWWSRMGSTLGARRCEL